MYIREQGKSIQLIRTKYDKVKQQGVQHVFARFPIKDTIEPPDSVTSLCTEAERDHLKEFWASRVAVTTEMAQEKLLDTAHEAIYEIAEAVPLLGTKENPSAMAAEIWHATLKLQKALKARGFDKPGKVAKAPKAPVVNEAQTELMV